MDHKMKGTHWRLHAAELLQKEKGLILTGAFGVLLALLSLIFMLVKGNDVPPQGDWIKPITFNFAIGLFIMTTALILPLAKFSVKGHRFFCGMLITSSFYAYATETIQTYRGVDPRFGKGDFLTNQLPGMVFGAASITIVVLYVVLMVKFFSRKRLQERPLLIIGIRYGFIASMLGFSSGIWMIFLQNRITAAGGNIMTIHFLGFHGLQAIPLVAWFLERSGVPFSRSVRWVHVTAWLWYLAIGCMFLQTYQGHAITALTPAMIVCCVLLIGWFSILLHSLLRYAKERRTILAELT
jgi:hypothetical protein